MDAKVTLSFNKNVIEKAKKYAESHNISLSRMLELILDKLTSKDHASLEALPISEWVNLISEGGPEYITKPKTNSKLKAEYHNRKK